MWRLECTLWKSATGSNSHTRVIVGSKFKSALVITLGLGMSAAALSLHLWRDGSAVPAGILLLVGIPLYLWGCCILADGKGYTTAIVVTAPLGLLLPLIILLALPDKLNQHQRQRRRRRRGGRSSRKSEMGELAESAPGAGYDGPE